MIPVYCFSGRSGNEVDDDVQQISEKIGHTITPEVASGGVWIRPWLDMHNARLVSPKKQMSCASSGCRQRLLHPRSLSYLVD